MANDKQTLSVKLEAEYLYGDGKFHEISPVPDVPISRCHSCGKEVPDAKGIRLAYCSYECYCDD